MKYKRFNLEKVGQALEDIALLVEQRATENPVRTMYLVRRMVDEALESVSESTQDCHEDIDF